MKRFTKALSMFLAILMVVSLLPLSVIAEDIQNAVSTHTVSFKLNYNGAHKIPSQKVADGECAVQPEDVTRTGWIFEYWYVKTGDGIQKFDLSQPITEDVTLYARWDEDITYWGPIWNRNILGAIADSEKEGKPETDGDISIDDYTDADNNGIPDSFEDIIGVGTDSYDSDKDGIPDYYEEIYGTDKFLVDTDGDGLPDGYELFSLGTSPTDIDTDNNTISDADEDADNDGLSNLTEYLLKTNPIDSDTDDDDLSDAYEINESLTDPLKKDTDNDELNDADEFKYLMDPNNPDTLDDGILDGHRRFDVILNGDKSDNGEIQPFLQINLEGRQIESLSINKIDNSDVMLNSAIPGYLGNAYDLNVEGAFSTAKLSFNLGENPPDDATIYYWNESTQTLDEVEGQSKVGDVLSVDLEHFSAYMLLDKSLYESAVLEFEIKAPTDEELQNKTFEVMLVLDESGSISSSNFTLMKNLCVSLMDSLADEDKVGVITFDSTVRKIIGLSNKNEATEAISNLYQHNGNTAVYNAINTAINELSNTDAGSTRIIIALTDGIDNRSSVSATSIAEKAAENNIVIYTVGIGASISVSDLTYIAEATQGQYYSSSDFASLQGIFERIIEDTDLYKDSDGDGISDYHEKAIANGKLKSGTGTPISLSLNLNYLREDSDGDGLFDGDEIEIRERNVNGKTVYYCYLYSNPCIQDTDGDELSDFEEDYAGFKPLMNDATNLYVYGASEKYGYVTGRGSFLNRNSFKEWLEMKNDHSWNYIHKAVQADIWTRHPSLYKGEYPLQLETTGKIVGWIDLLNVITSQIWDVKPASYQFPPNLQKGIAQLERYISVAPSCTGIYKYLSIGGSYIMNGTVALADYTVAYTNMNNGLIVYHFKRKLPAPIVVPEYSEESAKEPYQEFSSLDENDWKDMLWQAAKEFGYNAAQFGEWLLEFVKDAGELALDITQGIIDTGKEIGGFAGTCYIIVCMIPVLALIAAPGLTPI